MKNYQRTYATVPLRRNRSSSPRAPAWTMQRVEVSLALQEYFQDRLGAGRKLLLDVAAFHEVDVDGEETVTVVLSIPHKLTGEKARMFEGRMSTSTSVQALNNGQGGDL